MPLSSRHASTILNRFLDLIIPPMWLVAKREETVRKFRSTEKNEIASKCVNEYSFMMRIVRIPFIGRVLSHNIALDVFGKQEPFTFTITPGKCDYCVHRALRQNIWGADGQDYSMANQSLAH